jgi:hypothetical protein
MWAVAIFSEEHDLEIDFQVQGNEQNEDDGAVRMILLEPSFR